MVKFTSCSCNISLWMYLISDQVSSVWWFGPAPHSGWSCHLLRRWHPYPLGPASCQSSWQMREHTWRRHTCFSAMLAQKWRGPWSVSLHTFHWQDPVMGFYLDAGMKSQCVVSGWQLLPSFNAILGKGSTVLYEQLVICLSPSPWHTLLSRLSCTHLSRDTIQSCPSYCVLHKGWISSIVWSLSNPVVALVVWWLNWHTGCLLFTLYNSGAKPSQLQFLKLPFWKGRMEDKHQFLVHS